MFVPNSNIQTNIFDSFANMPDYKQKRLKNSWAYVFGIEIFPAINEERFSVLYSDKGSRPNTPINVIIGALTLKQLLGLTDKQLLENIYFDDRFEFALGLSSRQDKPPVSKNTFTNFRRRAKAYYEETGVDLIQEEVERISLLIAEKLEIDGQKVRVDSFMVASSCRNLSRIELIYTVNYKFIKKLKEISIDLIPDELKSYLEDGHKDETVYETKDSETETKLKFLLKQSKILYDAGIEAGSPVTKTEEFKNLKRMLREQTKDDDDFDNIEPKANEDISPDSLQNPSDPDATYRFKYNDNTGYVGNVAEIFDENGSIILFFDLQPNIYSDQKFSQDTIDKLSELFQKHEGETEDNGDEPKGIDPNLIQMMVDGAYYSSELAKNALAKGIELIPGELAGKNPNEDKMSYAETFILDEDQQEIQSCIGGAEPFHTEKNEDQFYAAFPKEACENCSCQESCRINTGKKSNSVTFSEKRYGTDKQREKMETEEYQQLTNLRAAIEAIPSSLRRKYNIDRMPIRGLVRTKFRLGFKILAYNVKKLVKGLKVAGV